MAYVPRDVIRRGTVCTWRDEDHVHTIRPRDRNPRRGRPVELRAAGAHVRDGVPAAHRLQDVQLHQDVLGRLQAERARGVRGGTRAAPDRDAAFVSADPERSGRYGAPAALFDANHLGPKLLDAPPRRQPKATTPPTSWTSSTRSWPTSTSSTPTTRPNSRDSRDGRAVSGVRRAERVPRRVVRGPRHAVRGARREDAVQRSRRNRGIRRDRTRMRMTMAKKTEPRPR